MPDETDQFLEITDRGEGRCAYVEWRCPLGCGFTVGFLARCGASDPIEPVREITRHLIYGKVVHECRLT